MKLSGIFAIRMHGLLTKKAGVFGIIYKPESLIHTREQQGIYSWFNWLI